MTNRLFVALDIPESALNELIELRDKLYGTPNKVRWESKEKLHITLKFLGDVGENVSELILRRFEDIEFPKISSSFSKFGFFKKNGLLKILFAGIDDNMKIEEFHKIINDECALLGFNKEDRKFKPHLTLLRIKENEDLNRLVVFNKKIIDNINFEINSFSVIKSELKPGGSEYSILKEFKLK
jgi:2'-5' RNA ligase